MEDQGVTTQAVVERGPDVLAYHDALIASHKALSADAYHAEQLLKAEAVRAAVAELIENRRTLITALASIASFTQLGCSPDSDHAEADFVAIHNTANAAITRIGGAK